MPLVRAEKGVVQSITDSKCAIQRHLANKSLQLNMQLLINSSMVLIGKKKGGAVQKNGKGGGNLPLLKVCTLIKTFCLLKNDYKIFFIF